MVLNIPLGQATRADLPHFTNAEMQVQRGHLICPKVTWQVAAERLRAHRQERFKVSSL